MAEPLTNDERFVGPRAHHYDLWLRQGPGRHLVRDPNYAMNDAAMWIPAAAAAAAGEAMGVLSVAGERRWKVCAGYMGTPGWNMYYRVSSRGMPEPLRPSDAAAEAVGIEMAIKWKRVVELHFFDSWVAGGALASPKYWAPPFLEPVST